MSRSRATKRKLFLLYCGATLEFFNSQVQGPEMHLLDNESAGHGSRPAGFNKASSVPKILADGRLPPPSMDHLDELEAQSIYILREAFARLKKLALLWSLGKDS